MAGMKKPGRLAPFRADTMALAKLRIELTWPRDWWQQSRGQIPRQRHPQFCLVLRSSRAQLDSGATAPPLGYEPMPAGRLSLAPTIRQPAANVQRQKSPHNGGLVVARAGGYSTPMDSDRLAIVRTT